MLAEEAVGEDALGCQVLELKVQGLQVQPLIVARPDEHGIAAENFGPMAVISVIASSKVCVSSAGVAQGGCRCGCACVPGP